MEDFKRGVKRKVRVIHKENHSEIRKIYLRAAEPRLHGRGQELKLLWYMLPVSFNLGRDFKNEVRRNF